MKAVAAVLALLAAGVHVYIYVLEAVRFDHPTTRAVFRIRSEEQAAAIKPWAYNQGFYNLFLGLAVVIGVVLLGAGHDVAGTTAIVFGCAVMLAAATLLAISDRAMARAALVQGMAPALALIAVLLAR